MTRRYCEARGEPEVADLERGMDFREPRYRREVFLRFWEFHLRYRSHPGIVYAVMPFLAQKYAWTEEQRLWFAFLNGNTQNPVTSWLIFREFPEVSRSKYMRSWFENHYDRLAFDTDRRYHKKSFLDSLDAYCKLTAGRQGDFFRRFYDSDAEANFRRLWPVVNKHFATFGRLSSYSYLEYLRVLGQPVLCDQLFLTDMSGSKSHRNGLAKVLGRDDLDWHDSNPSFQGNYDAATLEWLIDESAVLLADARRRMSHQPFVADVNYFTLESALCTYKSWHRPNRRYPNVYNDMFVERIEAGEKAFGERLDDFWESRAFLPPALRLEDNPADCGVRPRKQNHYRETGRTPMLGYDWPEMMSEFDEDVMAKQASR